MSAFIKFKNSEILTTTYKTFPSFSGTLQTSDSIFLFRTSNIYIESEEDFSIGSQRTYFDVNGQYLTGSWNLSGSIEVITNDIVTNSEKISINRLRNIYASGTFVKSENYTSSSIISASNITEQYMNIINIPSVYYGSEIKPGSFKLDIIPGLSWVQDDGYGGIISSGIFSPSEGFLIGSIFYQHGLVLLGHNSSFINFISSVISFSGTNEIPITMYICNAPRGMMNYSNNNSFTVFNSSSNKNEITTKENETFITTIGLYDEDYRLLGVAKVSKPIMNKEDINVQFRLKLNY